MPSLTIFPLEDAFNNNISGFYNFEDFLQASTSSSADGNVCNALWRFPAVSGLPGGATIIGKTFWAYEHQWSDIGGIGYLSLFNDINDVWGTLGPEDPPTVQMDYGTVGEGIVGSGVGWQSRALAAALPTDHPFNVGIKAFAGDTFQVTARFDSKRTGLSRAPYPAGSGHTDGRAFIVIDYTLPASDDGQRLLRLASAPRLTVQRVRR